MIRWPFPALCIFCILFSTIRPHGLLAASVHSSQHPRDSDESLRPAQKADNVAGSHEQSLEIGSNKRLPTGLHHARNLHTLFSFGHGGKRRVTDDLSKVQDIPYPYISQHRRGSNGNLQLQAPHVDIEGPKKVENASDREQPRKLESGSNSGKKNQERARDRREGIGEKRRDIENPSARPKELTVPMARAMHPKRPLYFKNTYPVWHDTRLAANYLSRVPRIHLQSFPVVKYYPDDAKLAKVCKKKSTLFSRYNYSSFNWGQNRKWDYIVRHNYNKAFTYRRVDKDVREFTDVTDYKFCHNWSPPYLTVVSYLNCAIWAYQNLEIMIPMYPLHQDGA